MTKYFTSLFILGLILASFTVAAAANGNDHSRGKGFGMGAQITAPFVAPDIFPASGLSLRYWILDLAGLEFNAFVLGDSPSFCPRLFFKVINAEIVDLYLGGGISLFTHLNAQGKTLLFLPLQAIFGLEIRLTPNIALNAELGLFGHSSQIKGITSGIGLHFYF